MKPIDEFIGEAERKVTEIRNECMKLNVDIIKRH